MFEEFSKHCLKVFEACLGLFGDMRFALALRRFGEAKMMSQHIASSQPPPSANPFTAAMVGAGKCSSFRNIF